MKVNLTVPAITLAGEPWKENGEILMLNKVVANRIALSEGKDKSIEMYELATKLFQAKGEVEIKESEKEMVKEAAKTLIAGLGAQILIIINNAK